MLRTRRTRGSRETRRGGVVLRGKITNPCLPPQRASLPTALRDVKVRESLSSPFALPRAAAAGAPCRGARRAPHSWYRPRPAASASWSTPCLPGLASTQIWASSSSTLPAGTRRSGRSPWPCSCRFRRWRRRDAEWTARPACCSPVRVAQGGPIHAFAQIPGAFRRRMLAGVILVTSILIRNSTCVQNIRDLSAPRVHTARTHPAGPII